MKLYNSQSLGVRIALLTTYIALVNSYALFVIYPTIKEASVWNDCVSLALYIIFSLPLLFYIAKRFRPKPRPLTLVIGLSLMVIATIIQYFVSHTSIPILVLHIIFYLFAGMVEETLWRGKLWKLVSEKITKSWAVLAVVTAHFVILHIPFAILEKQVPISFIGQVLALGLALGVLRILTKKVTIPAFAHAIINMVVYT
jgi:membrane protease YdiL (CAAX protease family)